MEGDHSDGDESDDDDDGSSLAEDEHHDEYPDVEKETGKHDDEMDNADHGEHGGGHDEEHEVMEADTHTEAAGEDVGGEEAPKSGETETA